MPKDNTILIEGKFGDGAPEQPKDERDIAFGSSAPFDWALGFDIELLLGYRATCKDVTEFFGQRGREGWGVDRYREIVAIIKEKNIQPFKIPVKMQGASSSCTGQGDTYYLSVLNFIETGEWVEISARDVYAYISVGFGKGAYLRDAMKLNVNRGIGTEKLVPCYHELQMSYGIVKNPYNETEYLVKPEETEELTECREMLQAKEYQSIGGAGEYRMDAMAWGMLMGFGVYFAVNGQNGKGWMTEYPQVPDVREWGHALFGGKAFLENGEKIISPINSWGTSVGVDGWQKLKKDYFITNNVRDPWTLIDKDNNWNMTKSNVKIIKDKNSPACGIWLPALSPEALESYCLNFGIEVPKKDNGEIDWEKWIDGKLELNN